VQFEETACLGFQKQARTNENIFFCLFYWGFWRVGGVERFFYIYFDSRWALHLSAFFEVSIPGLVLITMIIGLE